MTNCDYPPRGVSSKNNTTIYLDEVKRLVGVTGADIQLAEDQILLYRLLDAPGGGDGFNN